MRNDKPKNEIVELSFNFSLKIIDFCSLLEDQRKYPLAKQLFRSGTSIGANVREAQNAESKPDFIHKMKVAAKEADETNYWLSLCQTSDKLPFNEELLQQLTSIERILSKIISTSKKGVPM